jgi:sugar lactone lactonase YvrE
MKALLKMILPFLLCVPSSINFLAQSGIIRTDATSGLPLKSTLTITQRLDYPSSVAPDGTGGFYVAIKSQNRVYLVAADGQVRLVAGNGTHGYSGDKGPAVSAQLNYPESIAIDSTGNLYIADSANNCIRKVAPDGVITTIAGNGTRGYSGDGGPAVSARLSFPDGVAVNSTGNLYIADSMNHLIRKVTPDGVITTVAGKGSSDLPSLVDGGFGGDGGPAVSAQLNDPCDVAVDSTGNLYIADSTNRRIRKVSPDGVITTLAGNGTQGYSGDGGPAVSAQLNVPDGVAVDTEGNLYIADLFNNCIRKVTPDGVITTVTGNRVRGYRGDGSPAASAQLNDPCDVAVDSTGNLYIADSMNHRIRKVTPDGMITAIVAVTSGSIIGDGGPAVSAQLVNPSSVAVDSTGNLFIADSMNDRIRKVTNDGVITTVAGNGTRGYRGDGGSAVSAQLASPSSVDVDSAGTLFIADTLNHCIRKITPGGTITTVAGNGQYGYSGDGGSATAARLFMPMGVAVSSAGNLYIADIGNNRIRKITPDGVITTVSRYRPVGGGDENSSPDTSVEELSQHNIAVDSVENIYIPDMFNSVYKITPDGLTTTIAGNGMLGFSGDGGPATAAQLFMPMGVAVDAAGNLYIADAGNNRIRKITPDGTIMTVAGNRQFGYSGNGGQAKSAQLYWPRDVAVDAAGNLYIADTGNKRIRKVTPDGRINTVAGN